MRSWPVVRIGLISVARSIVPPVVAPAPTVEWISSMKRIGIGRLLSAVITALKRSSKSPRKRVPASSAAVSSEKTSAPCSTSGTSSCSSRAASPSASAVLPTPASPTNTGLFLRRRQRISSVRWSSGSRPIRGSRRAVPRARRQVHRVGAERIAGRRAAAVADAGVGVAAWDVSASDALPDDEGGHLADAVRDVLEHVEPRHALRGEELRRVRLGLLERGRQHVARLDFLPPRALHVQHRRLQHAAERHRLVRLLLLAALELLDVLVEVLVEIAAELGQIGAARGEDPLAVRVVRQRVEQVLQRQVRMMPGGRLAVRHGENDLE